MLHGLCEVYGGRKLSAAVHCPDVLVCCLAQIAQAVQRAVLLAKRESVFFPLNKAYSLPHRIDGYWGASKVMLRPAANGAGVIAGAFPCPVTTLALPADKSLQDSEDA